MSAKNVVLIVDDVALNVKVLVNLLKDTYELKIATDGQRALELAQSEPIPDLILLDIVMPDMDGYEVLESLKITSLTKNIPVIFVTASSSINDEEKGLNLGAVDYITKPISPAIVLARIKTHLTIKLQHDELLYNASHDQLTGMYNRHMLSEVGQRKFARALRQGTKLSAIILDIDHFKNVNDTYGHLAGDKVLITIANALKNNMRIEDFSARFGGEEFIIILENCDALNAKEKAEFLREKIQEADTNGVQVTSSFGICELDENHTDFDSLLKDADKALYKAKENGRNKVEIFTMLD